MTTPTIKTHELNEPAGRAEICGICQRQISRYTCPSCNLLYCSLKCFRSELHSRCSELFYRKEIEIGIRLDSSKTEDDRDKMVELLKQVDAQSAIDVDVPLHLSDEDSEEESLSDRFSAIDIATASTDDLLGLLTEKERNKFFASFKDPSSGLMRELLESTELENTRQLPWWDAPNPPSLPQRVPYGTQPDIMQVPTNLINQASGNASLLYNICAVLLAYAYVTRHLAVSPLSSAKNNPQDRDEARKTLSQYVPFLTDRKSKLLHTCLTDAVVSFWSQLHPGSVDNNTIVILLEDVVKLVRPRRIFVTGQISEERNCTAVLAADHPSATMIMVMSDVIALCNDPADSSAVVRRRSHIKMKLTFYAAHILSTPSSHLHALADEVFLLSKRMGKEAS